MPQILIIDDDLAVCRSLQLLLRRAGHEVDYRQRPAAGLELLKEKSLDLVLLDMNFSISSSGADGLRLVEELLSVRPDLSIILITAWATVQLAVEGMKRGAHDFLAKPWENEHLLRSVQTILELRQQIQPPPTASVGFERIIGASEELSEVLETAKRVAATEASVLITGESGTGKELVARAIHESSQRAPKSLVAVNLGGLPESLFESEIFGHKAGAFTDARTDRKGYLELAEGGSLFLDEVGDLSPSSQVKLLRVLQERQYSRLGESTLRRADFRLISATSRVLSELITKGNFREDLLYRINLVQLHLPPLRQRRSDIPLLADHFLDLAAERYAMERPELSSSASDWLRRQRWPGNIRQLQNLMDRSLILARAGKLSADDLQAGYQEGGGKSMEDLPVLELQEMEERMIRAALARHNNQITATARELGITRAALYRRLEKYGIQYERE
ncbi:MAG: sigma-54 dependent transcriptional regulator [Bacteroidota bacterium]